MGSIYTLIYSHIPMSRTLREIAKVGTGLVIADLVSVLWVSGAGFFPVTIMGITWNTTAIVPIIVFDLALILLLAHYGWNMRLPIDSPSERMLLQFVGTVFLAVALLHLIRIAFNWNVVIAHLTIPFWISWFGVFIPAYLSYASFHFALRARS